MLPFAACDSCCCGPTMFNKMPDYFGPLSWHVAHNFPVNFRHCDSKFINNIIGFLFANKIFSYKRGPNFSKDMKSTDKACLFLSHIPVTQHWHCLRQPPSCRHVIMSAGVKHRSKLTDLAKCTAHSASHLFNWTHQRLQEYSYNILIINTNWLNTIINMPPGHCTFLFLEMLIQVDIDVVSLHR